MRRRQADRNGFILVQTNCKILGLCTLMEQWGEKILQTNSKLEIIRIVLRGHFVLLN